MSLLDDLTAEVKRAAEERCTACEAVRECEDERERDALREALAGTLSMRALERIAQKNGLGFGHRTIKRHRVEGHTP